MGLSSCPQHTRVPSWCARSGEQSAGSSGTEGIDCPLKGQAVTSLALSIWDPEAVLQKPVKAFEHPCCRVGGDTEAKRLKTVNHRGRNALFVCLLTFMETWKHFAFPSNIHLLP